MQDALAAAITADSDGRASTGPVLLAAALVAGREAVAAESTHVLETHTEFDFAIAEHVGVRRAARTILGQKIVEYPLSIFVGEVDAVQGDAEFAAYRTGVLIISCDRAVAVIFAPIGHEETLHLMPLLAQQQRGDGRIDATRETHDDHEAITPSSP